MMHRALPLSALCAAALLASAGTAHAQRRAEPARAESMLQVTCNGATPDVTLHNRGAQGALNRALVVQGDAKRFYYEQALQHVRDGLFEDSTNARYPLAAGEAHMGLGALDEASRAWTRAVELCPELASLIEPMREEGWARTFQAGMEAFTAGDTAGALARWESAGAFYNRRPDPFYNLGVILSQRGDVEGSVRNFREALAALERAPEDTTAAGLLSRRETRANSLAALLSAGARLYGQGQLGTAEALFKEVAAQDSTNRDAWFNHALALYKQEKWVELEPVAARLVAIDPLNYNAHVIAFSALKGQADAATAAGNAARGQQIATRAVASAEAREALPVRLDGIALTNAEGSLGVAGQVTGGAAAAGTAVRVEFTFYGIGGERFTHTLSIPAPEKEQTATFQATVPTTAAVSSFSYRLLPG
ncbi:MAG TPA: hypothetical protein VNP72_04175 [Longimicrobium sp.]|nr:hypothetical protein [Longimicrobium sp.]